MSNRSKCLFGDIRNKRIQLNMQMLCSDILDKNIQDIISNRKGFLITIL